VKISEIRLRQITELAITHGTTALDVQLSVTKAELQQEQILGKEMRI